MFQRFSLLWKASLIAFLSSFCVMVIELVAARILAPHIGVSLYSWTSIIGVILAGIALGNFLGGKVADKSPSPFILMVIFLIGGLLTAAIMPLIRAVAVGGWSDSLPVMWNFLLKAACIFLLPALVLSMVSPMVIKLTLADVGQTGGVVGTIYALSTMGSLVGTFLTGFFLILWFGTSMIIWLIAAMLIIVGIIAWLFWRNQGRKVRILWVALSVLLAIALYTVLFLNRAQWQGTAVRESNYYTINIINEDDTKALVLDNLIHGYVDPSRPTYLKYGYLKVFAEMTGYVTQEKSQFRVLHLGGGTYMFPRYLELTYPRSINEVVEIDPAVTEVAFEYLGLSADTTIVTYNRDARLHLIERKESEKFDIVVGDVFNDRSTPYHLTTLEFDRLVKQHMTTDGVYMINIIDNYRSGQYLPAFVYTLKQVFKNVYLFTSGKQWADVRTSTFVMVATDRSIDEADYRLFITESGGQLVGQPHDEKGLDEYLQARQPILLTDDHAPTDILVLPLFRR